ncbi:MAG: YggU family protein [Pseudomonadota bacterium]|nr:YggU family protein [Pseudomonadota bacterium]
MTWYQFRKDSLRLFLLIQTNAAQNAISGLHGDTLKIRIQSQAIEGRANTLLINYLKVIFKVPAKNIHIHSGEHSRHKIIDIQGVTQLPPIFTPYVKPGDTQTNT